MRGATGPEGADYRARLISIHAPREGSDIGRLAASAEQRISIHAPREGSDRTICRDITQVWAFLSTLPVRGATGAGAPGSRWRERFLSTLPARGATPFARILPLPPAISIHAPREGSDSAVIRLAAPAEDFYPRSPRGERPTVSQLELAHRSISIHAPREGSDMGIPTGIKGISVFLSTLPARGATP